MDRLKKPLQGNETGRECEGSMKGLAGLPWAAPKVPEGYFTGRGIPPEECGV